MSLRLLLTSAILVVAPLAPAADPLPPEKAKAAFLKQLDRPKVPADVKDAPTIGSGQFAFSADARLS